MAAAELCLEDINTEHGVYKENAGLEQAVELHCGKCE